MKWELEPLEDSIVIQPAEWAYEASERDVDDDLDTYDMGDELLDDDAITAAEAGFIEGYVG